MKAEIAENSALMLKGTFFASSENRFSYQTVIF